jgi:HlyD family secretion protein
MAAQRVSALANIPEQAHASGAPQSERSLIVKTAAILPVLLACLMAAGCTPEKPGTLQGYAEGEYVLVAAPNSGTLRKLHVRRGQQVEQGAVLFELDSISEEAGRNEAAGRLRNAQERLANLRTGRRPAEIDATAAQAEQAKSSRELSQLQFRQQEKLFAAGFISQAQLDIARANFERDVSRVGETEAQGRVALQSLGREAEIRAAQAEVDAARAALAQAAWRQTQRAGMAPAAAMVHDTFFVEGEWVPAGRPVASLLPPQNLKMRFFVPEAQLGSIAVGQKVTAACDGCATPIEAAVSYISRQAEYNPPVLYNRDSRTKLVFMVEARASPADAQRLRPGQPLDVTLNNTPAAAPAR